MASSQLMSRIAFSASAASALVTSGYLFRDLADISQWIVGTNRQAVFDTHRQRHTLCGISLTSMVINTVVWWKTKPVPRWAWAAVNGTSLFLLYSGIINPQIMMRPRNKHAIYIPASKSLDLLSETEPVIVTKDGNDTPIAFPDSQILRPHVVQIGATPNGIPLIMTYCGLSHLGMAFEIPPHENGTHVELVPLTRLENNLVLLDKTSDTIFGQQINGVNETALLQQLDGLGKHSYHDTRRLPCPKVLNQMHQHHVAKQVPTWRMTLGNFVRTYPDGNVFINDYKMYKHWLASPIKTAYDALMDFVFEMTVYRQATSPSPVFDTIHHLDPRLPPKEQVWAFNIDEDHVAVTQAFVRDGTNGVRNLTVGGVPVVASWDSDTESLGIWCRPSMKPITQPVDIHGRVGGTSESLERLATVKNGAFWCIVANFFPDIRLNPDA